jgi:hypothetical protein
MGGLLVNSSSYQVSPRLKKKLKTKAAAAIDLIMCTVGLSCYTHILVTIKSNAKNAYWSLIVALNRIPSKCAKTVDN